MKNITNIQDLVDKKAEIRLKKDLRDMRSAVLNIPVLCANTDSDFPDMEFKGKKTKPYWFFNEGDNSFYDALYEYWLPIYKSQEAHNFINEVERLNENVNELMNNQQYE